MYIYMYIRYPVSNPMLGPPVEGISVSVSLCLCLSVSLSLCPCLAVSMPLCLCLTIVTHNDILPQNIRYQIIITCVTGDISCVTVAVFSC